MTSTSTFIRAAKALAILSMFASLSARSAAISTGVEQLLWPVVIIASPYFIVREFLFGSDKSAIKEANEEAEKIMNSYKDTIPASGLYTGSVNLRWALYGMLVESRLPFIEVNTAGSAWLLELSKVPQAMIKEAERHQYIRLSLGKQGDPNCFNWKSKSDDWTASPPVRPGTCVLATFGDKLQSTIQLNVDTTKVSSRQLRWELIDRKSSKILLSVPFWDSQTPGQPLRVVATYRASHDTYTFVKVVKKMTPLADPKTSDGRPYVLNRIEDLKIMRGDRSAAVNQVYGYFRPITLDWQTIDESRKNERWVDGYERAYSNGQPVLLNDTLLINPAQDSIRRACVSPTGAGFCDFAKSSLSNVGVLSWRQEASYYDPDNLRRTTAASLSRSMYMTVVGRKLDGELLWFLKIVPAGFPESQEECRNFQSGCYFYPRSATTTAQDLVFRGVFGRKPSYKNSSEEYEYFVPLDKLPATTARQ